MTKETAFAKAILAAGIIHVIARNCSSGHLRNCGCGNTPSTPRFNASNTVVTPTWGGCPDNIEYGAKIAKHYFSSVAEEDEVHAYFHNQNTLLGKMIIKKTREQQCRCLGPFGTCIEQSCSIKVAPFQRVAQELLRLYKRAVKVHWHDVATNRPKASSSNKLPGVNSNTMVYLDESPNYCNPDKKLGWWGTVGRECSKPRDKNVSHEERRSCRDICRSCGYVVKKQVSIVSEKCNCRFRFCCEVKCDTCAVRRERHFCQRP